MGLGFFAAGTDQALRDQRRSDGGDGSRAALPKLLGLVAHELGRSDGDALEEAAFAWIDAALPHVADPDDP